ncbi:hypothetical protein IF803_35455 [Bradyrhizobium sp. UFLA06-06]
MEDIKSLLDSYSRQARLFPAMLTIFAPLVTALAWFPELITSNIGSTLLTIASSCGLLYWLSSLARTRGKIVETRLLSEWGGMANYLSAPPQRPARPAHARSLPCVSRQERAGVGVANIVPGREGSAHHRPCLRLRDQMAQERVRKGFPLVDKENAQYGFRRNMRGMKPIALLAVGLAFIASLFAIWMQVAANVDVPSLRAALTAIGAAGTPPVWGATIFDFIGILAWVFVVRDSWVRSGGEQYAEGLLATCDKLSL